MHKTLTIEYIISIFKIIVSYKMCFALSEMFCLNFYGIFVFLFNTNILSKTVLNKLMHTFLNVIKWNINNSSFN